MIEGALIGALALGGGLLGLLAWQAIRAASAKDAELQGLKSISKHERQLDAQSRALEDRDSALRSLESTLARERARSAALKAQLLEAHELLSQVQPNEVSHALRGALARYRELLQMPEAESSSTTEGD